MTKIFVLLTDSVPKEAEAKFVAVLQKTPLTDSVSTLLLSKDAEARWERLLSRALLYYAYPALTSSPCPVLLKSRSGAPYFDTGVRVSISHTAGLVAVALSDEAGAIGVDVEGNVPDEERCQRVAERFLKELSSGHPVTPPEVLLTRLADPARLAFVSEKIDTQSEVEDFLSSFTRAEAVLKASGEGFGALSRLGTLSQRAEQFSGVLTLDGERFTLAFARDRETVLP